MLATLCQHTSYTGAFTNIGNGASLSKEATLSGRLCERTRRLDCVKLESMNAEGTWYEGTWNDWCWRNPGSLEFLEFIDTSSVLMDGALGTTFSLVNRGSPQWNSPVDTSPTMIHGSMVPDGAEWFRHSTERISDSTRGGFVSLCPMHEWPQRGKGR